MLLNLTWLIPLPLRCPPFAAQLTPDKVLFATDYPKSGGVLGKFKSSPLSDDLPRLVSLVELGRNLERHFPFFALSW